MCIFSKVLTQVGTYRFISFELAADFLFSADDYLEHFIWVVW